MAWSVKTIWPNKLFQVESTDVRLNYYPPNMHCLIHEIIDYYLLWGEKKDFTDETHLGFWDGRVSLNTIIMVFIWELQREIWQQKRRQGDQGGRDCRDVVTRQGMLEATRGGKQQISCRASGGSPIKTFDFRVVKLISDIWSQYFWQNEFFLFVLSHKVYGILLHKL